MRDTDHYRDEYEQGFVEKWDELIDWPRRSASEGEFFIEQLKSRGVESVLDVATGTGFHSVRLMEQGFETASADGSAEMLAKAFSNGLRFGGHILRVVQADWRWLNRDVRGPYDAIICLGNSFTHLFSERDRRKALAEFYTLLAHDGVLILDQRNYDALLDGDYGNKHTYYYCGEDVSAEPEHVDEGLARFVYTFADGFQAHLNMFPLRKDYTRRLMREVGFQRVETYGDFQETYHDAEPDFYIHVAEKSYHPKNDDQSKEYSAAVRTARDYYNSSDADEFYHRVWGGTDIHVGLYKGIEDLPDTNDIAEASRRTVGRMAGKLDLKPGVRVLDLGAGYGGSARQLAQTYGCQVTCLNLSEVENERNRAMNREAGLDHLIEVLDGSFEDVPAQDNSYDVIWSQDAFLHSGDRPLVLSEAARLLVRDGHLIFTDPMSADGTQKAALRPILARLHLETMGTPEFYRREASRLGFTQFDFEDLTQQLALHYGQVLAETERREEELSQHISQAYLDRMKEGLRNWVNGGQSGDLAWGIVHMRG